MRKYNITVNGKSYEVEVEEIFEGTNNAVSKKSVVQNRVEKSSVEPKIENVDKTPNKTVPKKAVNTNVAGEKITAPMPASVVDIKVSVGQSVNSGDVVMILEAMKMENEIVAPVSGKVLAVNVEKGATVDSEDVLVVIG